MTNINFKKLGKAFLIIILYLVIVPLIISIITSLFIKENPDNNILTIINLVTYIIDVLIILFIYRKTIKQEWHKYCQNFLKYLKIALKNWGTGFLLMVIFNMIIISIVGSIAQNEEQNRELLNQLPIFSIITMALLGPILEEFAFRKGFKEAFLTKKTFLIGTALIFGLAHIIGTFNFQNIAQVLYIIPYATLGYFFAKAYYETDCIFTSITCHVLHNSLAVFLILISQFIIGA